MFEILAEALPSGNIISTWLLRILYGLLAAFCFYLSNHYLGAKNVPTKSTSLKSKLVEAAKGQPNVLLKEATRLFNTEGACKENNADAIGWLCRRISCLPKHPINAKEFTVLSELDASIVRSVLLALLAKVVSEVGVPYLPARHSRLPNVISCATTQFCEGNRNSEEIGWASNLAFCLLRYCRCEGREMDLLFAKAFVCMANHQEVMVPPELLSLISSFSADRATVLAAWQELSAKERKGVLRALDASIKSRKTATRAMDAVTNLARAELPWFSLNAEFIKALLDPVTNETTTPIDSQHLDKIVECLYNICSNFNQNSSEVAKAKIPATITALIFDYEFCSLPQNAGDEATRTNIRLRLSYIVQKSLVTLDLVASLSDDTRASFTPEDINLLQLILREDRASRPEVVRLVEIVLTSLERNHNVRLTEQQAGQLPCTVASEKGTCPICIEDWELQDELVQLTTCSHAFHPKCIRSWVVRSATCPRCRCAISN